MNENKTKQAHFTATQLEPDILGLNHYYGGDAAAADLLFVYDFNKDVYGLSVADLINNFNNYCYDLVNTDDLNNAELISMYFNDYQLTIKIIDGYIQTPRYKKI